jgi:replicative DNA helicase
MIEGTRIPPQALDVEKTVLGSMLLGKDESDDAIESLMGEAAFYSTSHRIIYKTIRDMRFASMDIDVVSLAEELRKTSNLEGVGGEHFLSQLVDTVSTAKNIKQHCRILNKKAELRKYITLVSEVQGKAFNPEADPAKLSAELDTGLQEIRERDTGGRETMKSLLSKLWDKAEKTATGEISAISTGFQSLDRVLGGGFQKKLYYVLAARPGMGKTSLMLQMVLNAWELSQKKKVLIFSLEMSKEGLGFRMLAMKAEVKLETVKSGKYTYENKNKLSEASGVLYNENIVIYDKPMNVHEIKSCVAREKRTGEVALVAIDYLTRIEDVGKETTYQETNIKSKTCTEIAKECDVPVLCLAMISRQASNRANGKAMLQDLKESGNIEQDADVVMFIQKVQKSEEQLAEDRIVFANGGNFSPEDVIIDIAKQRDGVIANVPLKFMGYCVKFIEEQEVSLF